MPKPTPQQVTEELLALYNELLIPFMKVRRDMPFPTEPERQETDGEHAFTLAVLAPTLAQRLGLELNIDLVIRYALIHDLVEAYAGDISVRHAQYAHKAAKEHEALLQIEERFRGSAPWIADSIARYEARTDAESRFVYAADKLVGALARLADDGVSWADYYPETDGSTYHAVVKLLREKAEAYPELLPIFDYLHDYLDKEWPRYLGLNP